MCWPLFRASYSAAIMGSWRRFPNGWGTVFLTFQVVSPAVARIASHLGASHPKCGSFRVSDGADRLNFLS